MINNFIVVRFVVTIFLSFILIIAATNIVSSQVVEKSSKVVGKNDWITFSSPDKTFAINLPEFPKQGVKNSTKSREDETDVELYMFKCTKSVNYYILPSISNSKHSRLILREIDVSKCNRGKNDFEDDVFNFLVVDGGDNYSVLSDKVVNISGVSGRDITFKNGSEIYHRALIIESGKRLFVIVYDRIEGDLSEEDRIFKSFTLRIPTSTTSAICIKSLPAIRRPDRRIQSRSRRLKRRTSASQIIV